MPHPTGVVIGADVVVGEQCAIQQNVTLGGNYGRIRDGRVMPTLGARVAVSAGAVVVGPVVIGDDVVIGANVVVTRDVVSGTRLAAPRPVEIPERLEQRL
jgi:serine O-acetyltransferase